MIKPSEALAAFMTIAVASFALSLVMAHQEVARECERLGAFYVGVKVYECKLKGQP